MFERIIARLVSGVAFGRFVLLLILALSVQGYAATTELVGDSHSSAAMKQAMQQYKAAKSALALTESARAQSTGRAKLGRFVRALQDEREAALRSDQGEGTEQPQSRGNPFTRVRQGDQVQVHLYTETLDQTLLDQLAYAGLEIEISDTVLRQVQGWIAVSRLDQLAALAGVNRIKAPGYAESRLGSVTTAGDAILKANQLRSKGHTGKGIRVGIISDGSNSWTSARASGDLPATITRYGSCTTRSADPTRCISRRTCNEGTAMAEIIYDIAPDAKLAVAAAGTSLEFIQRVNQLVNTFKADIIVDDLGFFGEPYFEDGDIAKAVAGVANRVLFVSAAGNSADGHYEKDYRAIPGDSLHDFGRAEGQGQDDAMGVLIPGQSYVLMLMQWNDPFNFSSNDYDIGLFDSGFGLLTSSVEPQLGAGYEPFEGFCYYNSGSSQKLGFLLVNKASGANRRLELFNLSSSAQEYNHPGGSVFGHPGVESVLSVGTIQASDSGHNSITYYSSRGPSRVDYPALSNRRKPDVIGIDGVAVTGAGGFPSTFYGTSAAAPHVAGVAALLMSAASGVSATTVRSALKGSAVDLGAKGFDYTYGYGRVDAVKALDLLGSGFSITGALYLLLLN